MAFGEVEAVGMCQVKTPDLGSINNTVEAALYRKRTRMGSDEAVALQTNEMSRTLALLAAKGWCKAHGIPTGRVSGR